MRGLDLAFWQVSDLLLHTVGLGDYRITRERSGLYACALREWPGGCFGVFAEGYVTIGEALSACEADLCARMGGGL